MQAIQPNGYRERNAQRVASRLGLDFHLDGHLLTTHEGHRSETREATEAEQQLWAMSCSDADLEELPASKREVLDSWEYSEGPFTISPKDYFTIQSLGPDKFEPSTDKKDLLHGLIGCYKGYGGTSSPVYVSRVIYPGFYRVGPRLDVLHASTELGEVRELPRDVEMELLFDLKSFQVE